LVLNEAFQSSIGVSLTPPKIASSAATCARPSAPPKRSTASQRASHCVDR
jgi:hypothetical protein